MKTIRLLFLIILLLALGALVYIQYMPKLPETECTGSDVNGKYQIDENGKCVLKSCNNNWVLSGNKCVAKSEDGKEEEESDTVKCEGMWLDWTPCNKPCGGGMRYKEWKVTPGKTCENIPSTQSESCNIQACRACEGYWGSWSPCNTPCGGGKQYRSWIITRDAGVGGTCDNKGIRQPLDCNVHSCEAPRPPATEIQNAHTS